MSASVEGAAVTAARVDAQGTLRSLEGEATTDADGRFSLTTSQVAEADLLVLTATKADFAASALVYAEGETRAAAMPMTAESSAEADVYVEARSGSASDDPTAADVAMHVTTSVAADIQAGRTSAAEVALALRNRSQAEAHYVREDEKHDDDDVRAVNRQEDRAYARLQADLAVSANASAEAAALQAFSEALVEAYTAAGVELSTQAEARRAGVDALLSLSSNMAAETRAALQQQAEMLSATALGLAIEARFEASGASQTRLEALAKARADLVMTLQSGGEPEEGYDLYALEVEQALQAELNVDASVLSNAKLSLVQARAALDASISAAGSGEAVASAYAAFYASAATAIEAALSSSAKADFGAEILVLLAAQ